MAAEQDDEKISALMKEKAALVNKVEQLKELLETQTTEVNQKMAAFLVKPSKLRKTERDAVFNTEKLEEVLKTEKEKRQRCAWPKKWGKPPTRTKRCQ